MKPATVLYSFALTTAVSAEKFAPKFFNFPHAIVCPAVPNKVPGFTVTQPVLESVVRQSEISKTSSSAGRCGDWEYGAGDYTKYTVSEAIRTGRERIIIN